MDPYPRETRVLAPPLQDVSICVEWGGDGDKSFSRRFQQMQSQCSRFTTGPVTPACPREKTRGLLLLCGYLGVVMAFTDTWYHIRLYLHIWPNHLYKLQHPYHLKEHLFLYLSCSILKILLYLVYILKPTGFS